MEVAIRNMKIAVVVWNDRIAPVLDVARRIRVVRVASGRIVEQWEMSFQEGITTQKAVLLAEVGVTVLLCGAISRPLLDSMESYGIDVVPSIAGDWHDVLRSFLVGTLPRTYPALPSHNAMRRTTIARTRFRRSRNRKMES